MMAKCLLTLSMTDVMRLILMSTLILYGRRSERQRKKALRRFSNLQNDPLVIEDDVQDPEVETEDQGNDIHQGVYVQHEPELPDNDNDEDTEVEDDTDKQNNQDGNNNITEIQEQ
ncbi:hypothetical protein L1887_15174 [Cichorium endivia]|nr:hypothetical protein L1887_15174 [Cichorium endivia]